MTQWQSVLLEQQRYYNDRAAEYDDWWFRRGSFDEGDAANNRWCEEAAHVQEALDAAALQGDILELAAGTGIWSIRLLPTAQTLTLVDGSAQMLKINPATRDQRVRTVQADLFQWQATRTYDAVVFAFWISHVPRQLLPQFLRQVADALDAGGKFFFVDNLPKPEALSPHVVGLEGQLMQRRLRNGNVSTIVKNYYTTSELQAACSAAGLEVTVGQTPTFFQYGVGARR
ncbi:class I SAM-dependent DNA methyltransferase [Xanthomonas vasicola]|uniref:class I SAM-dependent DNA methyltransferase n=1 Tax=Xanthomonas vasicola TaxID=56459 RepID=UPI0001CC02CA|nr:class I SAM-dependent methyltransferase [Xanthomonas vasicola]KFA39714.1 rRNA adenine methyltransferase [Xanthomonas vasicola pv. musacearum NCPPB 4384]AZR29733.1 class I SAM-dependent methyltransferase [Xanthomonas vasicola pv. musacearum NCPPB 4379]KFA09727.1 rRNA adenine methyltransferase [Xanthomonas vasicola pv. musacearum NCPPB 2005]KFA15164.1 rRNA adenine methyltransferase [Xanthomonas vasicola pv. musacearum NCPPB 4380]KFA20414.1 rRNA adenine methyltransferase [Xanthomonas vasicola 